MILNMINDYYGNDGDARIMRCDKIYYYYYYYYNRPTRYTHPLKV